MENGELHMEPDGASSIFHFPFSALQSPISSLQYPISQYAIIALLITSGLFLAVAPLPLAAVSVAGIGFVLVLLVRPMIGLWVLPLAVPFGSIRQLSVAGSGVGAAEILIGLTVTAWLGHGIAHRQLRFKAPPLLVPLALLLGTMLLSALGMYAVAPTVKELVKWAEILIVYVLAFNLVTDRRVGLVLTGALLLAGSLSALHGIAGSLLHVGPPQFAILGGRLYRAFGTFGQPNPFGGYMNHTLPIAISLLMATLLRSLSSRHLVTASPLHPFTAAPLHPSTRSGQALCTLALLGVTGVLAAGLGLSWSRGAWLGAAAGLATVGLAWLTTIIIDKASDPASQALRRRAVAFLGLGTAVVTLFVLLGGYRLVPASVAERIDSAVATFTTLDARGANITDANFATLERVAHWQAAWDMWRDHFWTGIGIGNYEAAYPEYRLPKWPYALGHAHNIYFNMAAEIGLIGLLTYLVFVGLAIWHTWRVAWGSSAPEIRGLAIGVLGVLVALAVHNFFDNMYVHGMGVHLALALGVVSAFGSPDVSSRSENSRSGRSPTAPAPFSRFMAPPRGMLTDLSFADAPWYN